MKTIFELVYCTESGHEGNLLFSSKELANDMLANYYAKGMFAYDSIIKYSFVIERTLF